MKLKPSTLSTNDSVRLRAQSFALQWHLAEYPTGTLSGDFDAIVDRVANDELGEDIIPFHEFQDWSGESISKNIKTMSAALIKTFGGLNVLATK
jgi:hypothetical protein